MFCELHFHTQETSHCAKVPAVAGIRAFKEHGYECVVVTDHLNRSYYKEFYDGTLSYKDATDKWLMGYRTAKAEGDKLGVKVFLGCELDFDNGIAKNEYLVYGMTEEMFYEHSELWTLDEKSFKEFADSHGLFVAQAHPFRPWCKPCPAEHLHGVEVFNSHPRHDQRNHLAMEMWLTSDLIPLCGSDYHEADAVRGCGVDLVRDAESIQDIIAMLRKKEFRLVLPGEYTCPTRDTK
ncbi:MAG: PHP domain-containing protein [Clostridia bacterium]|nr:PHP domain-containing protein [Clostridia bacterium]